MADDVGDATTRVVIRVEITQKMINEAMQRSAFACPISLGMLDIEGVSQVCSGEKITFKYNKGYYIAETPKDIVASMRLFDSSGKMKPMDFEITANKRPK